MRLEAQHFFTGLWSLVFKQNLLKFLKKGFVNFHWKPWLGRDSYSDENVKFMDLIPILEMGSLGDLICQDRDILFYCYMIFGRLDVISSIKSCCIVKRQSNTLGWKQLPKANWPIINMQFIRFHFLVFREYLNHS